MNGCYYNEPSEVENLIEAMTKVRPEMLNEEATKLFNTIMKILDERETLIKERDYYKERYNEFNNAFIEGGRKLNKDHTCLHCGEGKPNYCERLFSRTCSR